HLNLLPAVAWIGLAIICFPTIGFAEPATVIRSANSGLWSSSDTWAGGKVPGPGSRVLVRTGHTIIYDVKMTDPVRAVFVSGALRFDPDGETLLAVGLLKVQPGESTAEEGFDCDAHVEMPKDGAPRPALEVGTPDKPVGKSATIRLVYLDGMDKESCPAIVC